MDNSFLELRCKEVVNVVDGRKLGHIVDVIFNLSSGCLQGFVVPGEKNFWGAFKNGADLFIPLNQIVKIGEDAVLVELFTNNKNTTYISSSNVGKSKK